MITIKTKEEIAVSIGFQPTICRECRGLPVESFPCASMRGQTSKIKRYYWRELFWRKMELLDESDPDVTSDCKSVEKKALEEIKILHNTNPKHEYVPEESQADLLARCDSS